MIDFLNKILTQDINYYLKEINFTNSTSDDELKLKQRFLKKFFLENLGYNNNWKIYNEKENFIYEE